MGRRVNTAVWLEKYNRWQIKVQKDGERRTFTCSTPGRAGQRECNQKADDWLDGGLIRPDIKAQKIFDTWIGELKETTGRGHWSLYEGFWNNWIKGKIGNTKVNAITEQMLQDVINKAHKAGLAKKTLQNIRACMAAFVKYCRKCKATTLIVENVYIPKNAPIGERTILQPDDLAKLLTQDKTIMRGKEVIEPYINAFRFEVTTGMRPGEVIGLKWSDIKDNKVSLKRSINKYNEETAGKNQNAQRTFILKPIDIASINNQRAYLLSIGVRSEYIFPHTDGEYINQRTYHKHWTTYRDHNGIAKATPYELRHTFVSINKELPVGLIKPVVGHGVDMDTYGTYGHEVSGEMEQVADMIQKQFEKVVGK